DLLVDETIPLLCFSIEESIVDRLRPARVQLCHDTPPYMQPRLRLAGCRCQCARLSWNRGVGLPTRWRSPDRGALASRTSREAPLVAVAYRRVDLAEPLHALEQMCVYAVLRISGKVAPLRASCADAHAPSPPSPCTPAWTSCTFPSLRVVPARSHR